GSAELAAFSGPVREVDTDDQETDGAHDELRPAGPGYPLSFTLRPVVDCASQSAATENDSPPRRKPPTTSDGQWTARYRRSNAMAATRTVASGMAIRFANPLGASRWTVRATSPKTMMARTMCPLG